MGRKRLSARRPGRQPKPRQFTTAGNCRASPIWCSPCRSRLPCRRRSAAREFLISISACRRISRKTNGSRRPRCNRATVRWFITRSCTLNRPAQNAASRLDFLFGVCARAWHYRSLPAVRPAHTGGLTLIFEMHYTPNGSVQQDTTRIGLVFADVKKIDKEVITAEIGNQQFAIPPGG